MKKIKLFSNYDSSENLLKRFKNNYPINNGSLQFTNDEDYDVAVLFNTYNDKIDDGIKNTAEIVLLVQEPSWSPVWNDMYFQFADHIVVHDKSLFPRIKDLEFSNIIEAPSFMWYHDHVNYQYFENTNKIKKRKKLSMIVSGINNTIPNTNYSKRIALVQALLNSDLDIDIFGKGLNIDDKRYKGPIEYKYQGLIPYEYSISIENSNEKNYVSEKLFDNFLCGTMPIYAGCPNIGDIYPETGYKLINLDSESIIEDIKEIIKDKPDSSDILKCKDIYFNKYNLYTFLENLLIKKK